MIKGFLNVLLCLVICTAALAQAEVVPLQNNDASFDNIKTRSQATVDERKVPDSLVALLQQDEAFWYANGAPVKKETAPAAKKNSLAWLQQKWVRNLFWIFFIGGFAAVLIWYLSALNIRLFRKPAAAIGHPNNDKVTEDIFSIDYAKEISIAVQAKNYRQAVRLYYLKTLSLLSQKHLIRYQQDRTNSEYVAQLYQTEWQQQFQLLTRRFEYTCYGQFDLAEPAFEKVQKDFETFYRQLHS